MKKTLSIVLLLTVVFLGLSSCGDGDGGGAQWVTYSGSDGSTAYTLKITETAARYAAQSGDSYELTAGNKRSTGTVTVSGNTIILTPNNSSGSVTITVSETGIVSISGNGFTWDNGGEFSPPASVTPTGYNSGGGGSGGGGGGGGTGLNGNWYDDRGGIMTLNNGSYKQKSDNVDVAEGRYTTSGNKFTLTMTRMNGAALAGSPGISPNQWYTEDQLRTALKNGFSKEYGGSDGLTDAMITQLIDQSIKGTFGPHEATYTLSGNTLTMDWEVSTQSFFASGITVYTRNGIGGGSGGGGGGGTGTNKWPPESILAEYGLSGLTPIEGATNAMYTTNSTPLYPGVSSLAIMFTGSTTTDNYVSGYFTQHGWTEQLKSVSADSVMYMYQKSGSSAIYNRDTDDNRCTISSSKGLADLYD